MNRRHFIGGTVSLTIVGLAGCVDDIDSGPEETADNDSEETVDSSPEDIVEEFFNAVADGDVETQEELIHEQSSSLQSTDGGPELTINEIESRTVNDMADRSSSSVSDEQIAQRREEFNDEIDEIGADDYAIVLFNIDIGEEDNVEEYYILVEDEQEWKLYAVAEDIGFEEEPTEQTAPQVAFDFEFASEYELMIMHAGGDHFDASNIAVDVGDTEAVSEAANWEVSGDWEETVRAGDEITVTDTTQTDNSGESVRIWWSSSDGESTNTLSERPWP